MYGEEKKEKRCGRCQGKGRGQWVSVTEHCGSCKYARIPSKLNIMRFLSRNFHLPCTVFWAWSTTTRVNLADVENGA